MDGKCFFEGNYEAVLISGDPFRHISHNTMATLLIDRQHGVRHVSETPLTTILSMVYSVLVMAIRTTSESELVSSLSMRLAR